MAMFGPDCNHARYYTPNYECHACARRRQRETPHTLESFQECANKELHRLLTASVYETLTTTRGMVYRTTEKYEERFWEIVGGVQSKPLKSWAYELGIKDDGYETVANGWVLSASGTATYTTEDGRTWTCRGYRPRGNAWCIFQQGGVTDWE